MGVAVVAALDFLAELGGLRRLAGAALRADRLLICASSRSLRSIAVERRTGGA